MSEISNYDAQKKKLENLCEKHNLTYRFRNKTYPITLTVRPLQGVSEQMSLLASAEENDYISPDASMVIYRKDGEDVKSKFSGTFTIGKALRNKFERIYEKMADYWLQYFFREIVTNSLSRVAMPVIDESEADDGDDEDFTYSDDDDDGDDNQEDPNEDQITAATQLVRYENKASIRLIAERLHVGLHLAGQIMDELERRGVVGAIIEGGKREVLPHDLPED